jgi:hypothetical protein
MRSHRLLDQSNENSGLKSDKSAKGFILVNVTWYLVLKQLCYNFPIHLIVELVRKRCNIIIASIDNIIIDVKDISEDVGEDLEVTVAVQAVKLVVQQLSILETDFVDKVACRRKKVVDLPWSAA